MRQIVTTGTGGTEVMKVEQRPDPVPAPGEVVIRVRAAGLNFADILARQGLYLPSGLALTEDQIFKVCDAVHEVLA